MLIARDELKFKNLITGNKKGSQLTALEN